MSSEHQSNNQIQGSENNFETICQRRIIELEQKVNKYCAEYDALMNLLPIGNHFTSVLNFQKDFSQISSKIDAFDEKITNLNGKQIEIDKNYWEQSYKDLQNMLKNNERQLNEIQKIQKQEEAFDDSVSFEGKLNQKVKTQSDIISSKLAHHKNNIELKKHSQVQKTERQVSKLVQNKIKTFYEPIFKELEEIGEELEIARLKIPMREVKKFHQFNYHRLLNEILETNQTIEDIYTSSQSQQLSNVKKVTQKMEQVERQIEFLHYQIQGSRNKCLNDLLTDQLFHSSSVSRVQTHKNIQNDFQQLRNNLLQLKAKFELIKKCLFNH